MRSADFIIIGGGPGGYEIAADLAADGRKVILIERDRLGGTCLNRGCIPTKCLCASASAAMTVADAASYGVDVPAFTLDYGRAVERAAAVMDQLRGGIEAMLRDVEVIIGEASLKPDKVVVVNGEHLTAGRIIIATGSRPAVPDIPGTSLAVTSDGFLSLTDVPRRVAIIGGGVIGLEFASILAAFGREVTVLEFCKEVLPQFDGEIAKRLRTTLSRRGIKFLTSTRVTAIEKGLRILYEGKRGNDSLDCDLAVMAVGRHPVMPQGIEAAGIELDGRGFIKVDELMETSVGGIYAVGDVNGLCMLAHAASAQARRASGIDVNLDIIPSAVFTSPEAAMVGMTEDRARKKGHELMIGKASFAANGKALAMAESDGTVKIIFDRESGLILGCHIIGPHAADLIAEVAALMFGMTTREELAEKLVHGHPTLSEALQDASRNARSR